MSRNMSVILNLIQRGNDTEFPSVEITRFVNDMSRQFAEYVDFEIIKPEVEEFENMANSREAPGL